MNCVKTEICTKVKLHTNRLFAFDSSLSTLSARGAEYTTPFIALMCKTGDERKDGNLKTAFKENNQIALRNTDYIFSGKSIIDKKTKQINIK